MGLLQLLASRNYITVNKVLIKEIGLEETILLGELASEYDYWESQDKLEDSFFFSTVEIIEENTTLTDYQQRKALNTLQDMGLVEVKIKGLPPKRYIKINEEAILKKLKNKNLKNLRIKSKKTKELILKKLKTNNNIINNNKENNNNKLLLQKKVFKKPTLEEVQEYCKQRNNNIDPKAFFDYFETSNWVDSKGNKVKNWKQKVITWENFSSKKQEMPSWFDKDIKEQSITKEEQDEIDDILNNF